MLNGAASTSATWRWRMLAACIVAAEVLKHLLLFALGQTQPWGDSASYWQLAGDAAGGDWWLAASGQTSRTPGYPWFLALMRWAADPRALVSAVGVQHLAVLATSALTAGITGAVTRRTSLALAAWLWCACSTARPLYANWLLTETLATCALTLFLACLVRPTPRLTSAAAALGLGILIRPALMAAVPVWLIAVAWEWRSTPVPKRVWHLLAGPVILAAVLTPWCLRNWQLHDRFALTIFTGRELWKSAFDPWPGGELPIPEDAAGARVRQLLSGGDVDLRHNWSVAAALSERGLNEVELDELMEQCARQAIARHPGQFAVRMLARCATFWYVWEWETDLALDAPGSNYAGQLRFANRNWQVRGAQLLRMTPERQPVLMWAWSALAWAGVGGLLWRRETRRYGVLLLATFAGFTVLTAALEVPLYRYRLVLEPLMIVTSVAGSAAAITSMRDASRTRRHPTAG